MSWFLIALKKYAVFSGRARRKEYWFFMLFGTIFSFLFLGIDFALGTIEPETGSGLLNGIYSLAVLLPGFAVMVRRLHDRGRSAWWLLIGLIPIIGLIVLIVFHCQDSEPGENKYGPNPKMISA